MSQRQLALWTLALVVPLVGRADEEPKSAPDEPVADAPATLPKAEDVESVDAIIKALYDTISGPKGESRDLDRFRSLFAPDARLIPIIVYQDGKAAVRAMDVDEFLDITGPAFERDGFYETEIARKTDAFGHIVHAFSTYETRRAKDEDPFTRGINSIQLYNDTKRWWVLTIAWDTERVNNLIPEEYLPES